MTTARTPEIDAVVAAAWRLLEGRRADLERRREAAVLALVDARLHATETQARQQRADSIVGTYTQRAVLAAMATVAPGTDLLVHGALAVAMLRALAELHSVPLRTVEAEGLLRELMPGLRGRMALVLAIAGNAAKAFPGVGTLGGGLLHAVAYGLLFQALGRAAAEALAREGSLGRDQVLAGLERQVSEAALADQALSLLRFVLGRKVGPG